MKRHSQDKSGQRLVEISLILVLVAVIVIVGLILFGSSLDQEIDRLIQAIRQT